MKTGIGNFTAVNRIEGIEPVENEDQMIEAWQHLIDNGLVWKLQGGYGRAAQDLIDSGTCHSPMDRR